MTESTAPQSKRRRFRRAWFLLAPVVLVAFALGALPGIVGTRRGHAWLMARANEVIAPASLQTKTLELSWFGSTRLTGVVLRDGRGKTVLSAPRASLDRNLWQLLFDRPRLGSLVLNEAAIDVERSADGAIDLYEAIRPLVKNDPRLSLRIVVKNGRLVFRSEGLAEPVRAGHADLDLFLAPSPRPVSWQVDLANDDATGGAVAESLSIEGRFNAWQARAGDPANLDVSLSGKRWPLSLNLAGLQASGRFGGKLQARRDNGHWTSTGDSSLLDVHVEGSALRGDRLLAEQATGAWDVSSSDAGWTARRLDLTSPFATLRAKPSAETSSSRNLELEGRLDLVALAAQIPHALRLREGVRLDQGSAELRMMLTNRQSANGGDLDVSARVSDLRVREGDRVFTLHDPAKVSVRLVQSAERAYEIDHLKAETPYIDATVRGDHEQRLTTLNATFDLNGFQKQFRELIDFGKAELDGRGTLRGEYRIKPEGYAGSLQASLGPWKVAGIGPAALGGEQGSLDLNVSGPVAKSGLPEGWSEARSRLRAGQIEGDFRASAATALAELTFKTSVTFGERHPDIGANLSAHWTDQFVDFDRFAVGLSPVANEPGLPPLRLAARGRYDRTKDELSLTPAATEPGAAFSLSPEGLLIQGLMSEKSLRGELGLVGDLAPLGVWLPRAAGLSGTWKAGAKVRPRDAGWIVEAKVEARDLATSQGNERRELPGGIGATFSASLLRGADRVDFSELTVTSPYASLGAAGQLTDLRGRRHLEVDGRIAPSWDRINRALAENVEPGAKVQGRPRVVRLRADLTSSWRETLEGEVGLNLDGADFYGMKVGPTPVVVRAKKGQLSLDPVDVTINGGQLHVELDVNLDGEGGPNLRLRPGTALTDAEINDEVSHRVLSFVAPVLDHATRVRGRVSAEIDDAVIPLTRGEPMKAKGAVVFQDVECLPGSFLDPLMGLIGQTGRPLVRLNDPVSLTIADHRIYQTGLAIPVGKITSIGVEGWVDFDRNLNLVASIPVLPNPLAGTPVLGDVAGGVAVKVPIRGTLDKPEVDKDAFNVGLKEMGKGMLDRTLGQGVGSLLDLITRPRDPNAPPPPPRLTPEQRRARQRERQAERRLRRGLEP